MGGGKGKTERMGADKLGGSCHGPGVSRAAQVGPGRRDEEKGTDLWGTEKVRSAGLEGVHLEASAFTDGVLGRSGFPVQFRQGESEVLSRLPGGLGWEV